MKHRIASFAGGFFAVLALSLCLTTALAASGKISYNFANVCLDGGTVIVAGADISAANGQMIPGSILYTDEAGGKTNYLPLRKISDLLKVEVSYDSATKTIFLGKQPGKADQTAQPAAEPTADENVIDLRIPKEVPKNPRRGDEALIKSRGGTILPDDDVNSYRGNDKMFKDKNGELRWEYKVGNEGILTNLDKAAAEWSIVDGDFPKNKKGESYGSMLLAEYVGYMPDLVQMAEGYVRWDEFDAASRSLSGLSEEECPHEWSSPLYNEEGEVIGDYQSSCGGHYDFSGMTKEEVRAAIERGDFNQPTPPASNT